MRLLCTVAVLFFLASPTARGQVIPLELEMGSQGDFFAAPGGLTLADDGAWFVFTITEQTMIDIDISRTVPEPDLGASLFGGDVTGFSFGRLLVSQMFTSSFGPLAFIELADDEEEDTLGGPGGDPRFQLLLFPGTYSLLVYSYTNPGGTFLIESNVGISNVILGDVNLDGVVNLLDVDFFIDRLATGTFQAEADCNQDGEVNLLDIDPFIAILAGA